MKNISIRVVDGFVGKRYQQQHSIQNKEGCVKAGSNNIAEREITGIRIELEKKKKNVREENREEK